MAVGCLEEIKVSLLTDDGRTFKTVRGMKSEVRHGRGEMG
jgi:hypothetical protein